MILDLCTLVCVLTTRSLVAFPYHIFYPLHPSPFDSYFLRNAGFQARQDEVLVDKSWDFGAVAFPPLGIGGVGGVSPNPLPPGFKSRGGP